MKRSHLRWLIPIIVYFIAVAVILSMYRGVIYRRAASAKLTEMALTIGEEVRDRDMVMNEAMSSVTMAGKAMSLYVMNYNDNQIKTLLKDIVDETELTNAIVCDEEGNGYDYLGKDISIGSEEYFSIINSEYSKGGTGMVLPDRSENARNTECLIVYGIKFSNRERGYLVATLPIDTLANQLFREQYIMDKVAVVTINGDILADGRGKRADDFSESASFWEQLPPGISKDTIKLSISQKNIYMGPVQDYGYVFVIPFASAGGGAVVFVRESAMEAMTRETMDYYGAEAFRLLLASAFLIALVLISNFLSDLIEKRIRKKRYEAHDQDELTGLLNRESAMVEIKKYTEAEVGKRGILFLLELSDVKEARENKGDAFADEKLKEFASSLDGRFRSTDIVARFEDDKFLVFLKDIYDQKDIRKQTDEMQLFLHDTRFIDADKEITVNAGAAIYPDNGRNVSDAVIAAKKALDRSKVVGKGVLSF